nr:unnamed protein product [Digitaria exilis]
MEPSARELRTGGIARCVIVGVRLRWGERKGVRTGEASRFDSPLSLF